MIFHCRLHTHWCEPMSKEFHITCDIPEICQACAKNMFTYVILLRPALELQEAMDKLAFQLGSHSPI